MRIDKQEVISRLTSSDYHHLVPSLKRGAGNTAQGLCPFHDDHRPSLTVSLDTGRYKCFGCGAKGDAFDLYMKINGVDFRTALETLAGWADVTEHTNMRETKAYEYHDEAGGLLYQVVRFEPKSFRQRRPDGNGGWVWGLRDTRRVLYNLPAVIQAQEVFLVEGEKDADRLNQTGLVATTCPMGAGKWRREYTESLRNKDVVILPDNDEPGREHAQIVARELHGKAGSVKVVEIPGLPEKGDVSDWLKSGHTSAELEAVVHDAPGWELGQNEPKIPLVSSVELMGSEAKPVDWIVEGLVPIGNTILLAAPPSYFKTWLAMHLALCVADGRDFLGRRTVRTPVIYIDRENPMNVLKDRLGKLGQSENLSFWPIWAEPEPPALIEGLAHYKSLAKDGPMIILDSLMRFHDEDENDAMQMGRVTKALRDICRNGATLLVLHHAGKGDDSTYRGSSEILGGVDIAFTIKKSDAGLVLKGIKNRLVIEPKIPIRVVDDGVRLSFEDVSAEEKEARERERSAELQTVRDAIEILTTENGKPPRQGEIIDQAMSTYGFARDRVTALLVAGTGELWQIEQGPKNARLYHLLDGSNQFPSSRNPYSEPETRKQDNRDIIETIDLTPKEDCQNDSHVSV